MEQGGRTGAAGNGSHEGQSTVEPSPAIGQVARELVVLEPKGLTFHLLADVGRVRIGRADDCEVKVSDPLASRHHAVLELAPLTVEDEGSANGTRVDNVDLQ